ncbi:HEPN domain-containing protein [Pyrodictium abyssi]|uniref:HEPN domain-containing protein n=1 Tax=Pyrodictium abyssi TaxID=54256 RepID=A0ABM8IY88_9CREN|nr:HEPN domain-containing protein [Pyrodictium abyssi]
MSIEEYRLLMRRALMFLDEAREAYSRDRHDLAMFLAEQALQLFLKAQLLRMLGDYPRTHSVRQLLTMLGKALGDNAEKEITAFIRRERPRLSELEDVYIVSQVRVPHLYQG